MASLATVEPQWAGVVDHDSIHGDVALRHASLDRHEARLDAASRGSTTVASSRCAIGDRLHGGTWAVKAGLSDGVVTSPELELNHGAGLCGDALRPELGARCVVGGVPSNVDDLDVDGWDV